MKNQTNSHTKIISTEKNSYNFEKKTQKLIVTVVALEIKYGMRIAYNPINYYYKEKNNLLIILIVCGTASLFIVLLLIFYLYKKYKKKKLIIHTNNGDSLAPINTNEDCAPLVTIYEK